MNRPVTLKSPHESKRSGQYYSTSVKARVKGAIKSLEAQGIDVCKDDVFKTFDVACSASYEVLRADSSQTRSNSVIDSLEKTSANPQRSGMEQAETLPSNPVDETQAPGSGKDYDEGSYHSSSDEDFDPSAVNPELNLSDSEREGAEEGDETPQPMNKKRKRGQQRRHMNDADDKEPDFHNSGDEAVVRKRHHKGHGYPDDEGGPGGLIKTRAQRAKECVLSIPSKSRRDSLALLKLTTFVIGYKRRRLYPTSLTSRWTLMHSGQPCAVRDLQQRITYQSQDNQPQHKDQEQIPWPTPSRAQRERY